MEIICTSLFVVILKSVNPITIERSQSLFDDITIQFKKRCTEVTLGRIWLVPIKVWPMLKGELVGKFPKGILYYFTAIS